MRAAAIIFGVAVALGLFAGSAVAEPPYLATCGVVRAFTPPSSTAAGSITIGDQSFALTSRDQVGQVVPPQIGSLTCLDQTVTTSGPVLTLVPVPSPFCGEIMGASAASIDIRVAANFRTVVPLAAAFQGPAPASGVACFETDTDAAGRLVLTRLLSATPTAAPTRAPAPRSLPSTSTAGPRTDIPALAVLAAVAAALLGTARSRHHRLSR